MLRCLFSSVLCIRQAVHLTGCAYDTVSDPRGMSSALAAIIHAASDQTLRQPEKTDETSRDDEKGQG